uniref:Uncharacterized protein n=1 Tax=Strombidium rassoulzadegani TaxID=1082188 RepID=A0A7S3CUF8_9SPIT
MLVAVLELSLELVAGVEVVDLASALELVVLNGPIVDDLGVFELDRAPLSLDVLALFHLALSKNFLSYLHLEVASKAVTLEPALILEVIEALEVELTQCLVVVVEGVPAVVGEGANIGVLPASVCVLSFSAVLFALMDSSFVDVAVGVADNSVLAVEQVGLEHA